ncbi:hypothetical protein NL676_022980 [Syzygium grande]|nr:hypothetical protein NL676_022980 [Syzygium grande]
MELSLDLSLAREPRAVSEFLREVSGTPDRGERVSKVDEYVARLQEEVRKIDPFKRELPLCMLLLNDAMERLKEEQLQCKRSESIRPKRNSDRDKRVEVEDKDSGDQKKWMSSPDQNLDHRAAEENPIEPCSYKKKGGAFLPFGLQRAPPKEGKDSSPISRLTLSTPTSMLASPDTDNLKKLGIEAPFSKDHMKLQRSPQQQQQQQQALRKQRRCWSPELHRRFVEALEQLGGAQVATPKQIRELMQVEGLTNDEVKSHLQKYRLHIRRIPSPSAATENGLSLLQERRAVDRSELRTSESDDSPQSPLLARASVLAVSSAGGDSTEMTDGEENSEGHSWITVLGEKLAAH